MIISIIAAMAKNRVIGLNNAMPWHLPADFQHLKKITMGKPIVMGRKTFASIGKPLPGRENIVITRDREFNFAGVHVFHSLEDALQAFATWQEVIIFGGATLYQKALPIADKMYLTYIDLETKGDVFFPEFDLNEWREISIEKHHKDEKNPYDYQFADLDRETSRCKV